MTAWYWWVVIIWAVLVLFVGGFASRITGEENDFYFTVAIALLGLFWPIIIPVIAIYYTGKGAAVLVGRFLRWRRESE